MANWSKHPIEGYLLDLFLLLLVIGRLSFAESGIEFSQDTYRYLYWSVGLLQCLALYSVFSGGLDVANEESSSFVARFLAPLSGLFMVLSLGAFVWLYIPVEAVGAESSMMFNFIVVLFGSWIALGVSLGKRFNHESLLHRYLTASFVLIYLGVSESLLIYSAEQTENGPMAAIFGALISYLPIRIMLILREPVDDKEALFAFGSFGYFLYKLSTEV